MNEIAQTPSEAPQNVDVEWANRSTSTDADVSSGTVEDCYPYYEAFYEPHLMSKYINLNWSDISVTILKMS